MNQRIRLIALGFALLCGAASAAGPDDDVQKIPVDGIRNPEMKSYRAVWAGLDMFDKEHDLAPAVPQVRFRIFTNHSTCIGYCGLSSQTAIGAGEPAFGLRIASDNESIQVPVSPEGLFAVPRNQAAYDDKADLVLNRKKNSYRMWPEVRTPGLPENVRRLGDLRLECKVQIAITKEEMPFFFVAFVNSLLLTTDWCMKGEFHGEKFKFGYLSPQPLLSATLVHGDRSEKLESKKRNYQVPLGDRSWPDDALVQLEYAPAAQAGALQDHPGYWVGNVTLPDGQVRKLGAEFFNRADGAAWASVAWPEQGVVDIPVKAIRPEPGDAFVLDLGAATLRLAWVEDHFQGEWKQGKATLQAELRQVAAYPRRARPQTPQAPFPYRNETLAIHSTDGVTLGATLSVPAAPAHPNVVVLVAGSGPMSRHADVDGHLLFDVLADHLARQGVAVLRYDKRGISRSTGDYYGHTSKELADDLHAVVQALAARKEFGHIGLVGHSEGSQIAAAVAARDPEAIGFVVSMGGVGLSGFDLMLLQDRQWARDHGASPQEVERVTPYDRKYYETVLATPDGEPRIAALKSLYAGLAPAEQALITKFEMNEGTLAPSMAAQPFLPVILKADPRKDWSRVRSPVLVLSGSLDHQVPPDEDVAGIVAALKHGGNTSVEAAILPSLNHVFQTAKTGKEDEYAEIAETMAPVALQKVADFARKQR